MGKTENVELTVLCMIESGEKILLQNRIKKDWRGYALPGGHVEQGESFVDAVIREMREETGLTVVDPRLVGVMAGMLYCFLRQPSGLEMSSPPRRDKWSGSNIATSQKSKPLMILMNY